MMLFLTLVKTSDRAHGLKMRLNGDTAWGWGIAYIIVKQELAGWGDLGTQNA